MTILTRGEISSKEVDCTMMVDVIPYVGTDYDGHSGQMGFGYYMPGGLFNNRFFGPVVPHLLIRTWRAMKILEASKSVEPDNFLRTIWFASIADDTPSVQPMIHDLAKRCFDTIAQFDEVRAEVLSSCPDSDTLSTMLRVAWLNGIDIDVDELRQLVADSAIEEPPGLNLFNYRH